MKLENTKLVRFLYQVKNYFLKETDPVLLTFLLLMLNYRFSFKIIAILGIYFLRPNFKIKRDGITFFYASMIVLGILNILLIHRDYSFNHFMIVFAGAMIWLTCLLSYHQIKLSIDKNDPARIINTLKVIVVFNFLASIFDISKAIYITGTFNPYAQICPPPYGISTGDVIGGVFGQMHLVNTIVSCLLTVFFVYNRSILFSLLCLIPFLLTGSNLATIIIIGLLIYIIVLKKDLILKYYAIFSLLIIVIFYAKITSQNLEYMMKTLGKVQSQFQKKPVIQANVDVPSVDVKKRALTKDELISYFIEYKERLKKDTLRKAIKREHTQVLKSLTELEERREHFKKKEIDYTWYRKDSLSTAKLRNSFFEYGRLRKYDLEVESGKITSFKQTKTYMLSDWRNLLFGSGIGSFSSRLAYITSGIVDDSKILMLLPKYETSDFVNNHKSIFKYLMFLDDETHSITNLPFSWYNQLFGEYGLVGFFIFCFAYLGFFIKRFSLLSYGKILIFAMIVFFLFDYWHERLSVVLVFELITLLDIKTKMIKNQISQ